MQEIQIQEEVGLHKDLRRVRGTAAVGTAAVGTAAIGAAAAPVAAPSRLQRPKQRQDM